MEIENVMGQKILEDYVFVIKCPDAAIGLTKGPITVFLMLKHRNLLYRLNAILKPPLIYRIFLKNEKLLLYYNQRAVAYTTYMKIILIEMCNR